MGLRGRCQLDLVCQQRPSRGGKGEKRTESPTDVIDFTIGYVSEVSYLSCPSLLHCHSRLLTLLKTICFKMYPFLGVVGTIGTAPSHSFIQEVPSLAGGMLVAEYSIPGIQAQIGVHVRTWSYHSVEALRYSTGTSQRRGTVREHQRFSSITTPSGNVDFPTQPLTVYPNPSLCCC